MQQSRKANEISTRFDKYPRSPKKKKGNQAIREKAAAAVWGELKRLGPFKVWGQEKGDCLSKFVKVLGKFRENGCLNRSCKTPLKSLMHQRWMLKNQEENRLQITATRMWSPQTLTDERCCQREQWARWTTDVMHFFTFLMSIKASPFASTAEAWSLLLP